jgi:ATP-dependent DNA ligase
MAVWSLKKERQKMDDLMIKTIKQLTDKFEQFLKVCKAEGDATIDDVLKRLEELRKET